MTLYYVIDPSLLVKCQDIDAEAIRSIALKKHLQRIEALTASISVLGLIYLDVIKNVAGLDSKSKFVTSYINRKAKCFVADDLRDVDPDTMADLFALIIPGDMGGDELSDESALLGQVINNMLGVAWERLIGEPDPHDFVLLTYMRENLSSCTIGLNNDLISAASILKKKYWRIRVKLEIDGQLVQKSIVCLYNNRNWELRWTSRYHDELPTMTDNPEGAYPFCPPTNWIDLDENSVVGAKNNLYGWVDRFGYVWAEPWQREALSKDKSGKGKKKKGGSKKGGQCHWDVEIAPGDKKYVNVCRFIPENSDKCSKKERGNKKPGDRDHGDVPQSVEDGWRKKCE